MAIPAYDKNLDKYMQSDLIGPARFASPITPSDTVAPAIGNSGCYPKALYIGVSGDVAVVPAGNNETAPTPIVFKAHPVGYLPMQVRMVMSAGTTATNILGLAD